MVRKYCKEALSFAAAMVSIALLADAKAAKAAKRFATGGEVTSFHYVTNGVGYTAFLHTFTNTVASTFSAPSCTTAIRTIRTRHTLVSKNLPRYAPDTRRMRSYVRARTDVRRIMATDFRSAIIRGAKIAKRSGTCAA